MERGEIISKIETRKDQLAETISLQARFLRQPLRAALFYFLIFCNRHTPLTFPVKTKTIWGSAIEAYESSAIGSVYFLGFYDIDVTLFLLKHQHATGDFVDIGSNIGYYAILARELHELQGRIIAIEPTPSTFTTLKKNTENYSEIVPIQAALSESEGTTSFIDYGNRYAVFNSMKDHALPFLENKGTKIDVKTMTLDALCDAHNLQPSILKLDTEGTESKILSGAGRTLATHAPIILLEVGGGEEWSKNNNDCLNTLITHDYSIFEATENGSLIPHARQATYDYKNLVCIPKSKIHRYVPNA